MGKINFANIKKTIYYLKRNGIKNTWHAVRERLGQQQKVPYSFVPVSEEELKEQRKWAADKKTTFSIVVPTYRTNEIYLREMIASVQQQSYPLWELILADATEDDRVKVAIDKITVDIKSKKDDEGAICRSIRYVKLPSNAGIAANTNEGLKHAKGEYIGLLDHDDVLTENALYEMAVRIEEGKKQGVELQMLYSDEDKCNGDRTDYYELNRKEKFNLDLLLSNNYICHFLVMKSELIKELGFRSEYDGAQDYDLVLRAARKLQTNEEQVSYIPKVLYHWRCHTGSTAENPQSKQYAYDAGLRALQDFADEEGYHAKAVHLKHLGFYRLEYPEGILTQRRDLGAVGGRVLGYMDIQYAEDGPTGGKKRITPGGLKVIGGRMVSEEEIYYEGTPADYSGYLHRAVLTQTAEAVDIRCIQVRKECRDIFEQVVGVPYAEVKLECERLAEPVWIFNVSTLPKDADYKKLSIKLGKALREAGYRLLYYPALEIIRKGDGNV